MLARALADSGAADDLMGRANALKESGWIDNSGLAGVAERMFSGWASKKMSEKARNQQADAETRRMAAQEGVDERKAEKDAARSEAVSNRERTRRQAIARQMGLSNREAVEFIETGKVPNAQRGEFVETANGIMYGDPYTGKLGDVNQGGQRQAQGPQVNFEGDVPDEVKRHILANQDQWEGGGPVTIPEQQGGRIMPYEKPPSAIELEKLRLMQRSADRADGAETRAQEAARLAAEAAERKANAPNAALDQWVEARKGLEAGLGRTETGPLVGRIPAFTTDQQIAEGSVAATAPILKQIFRIAGEGTFTDKDQELLMRMVPTRTDTEEARKAKIENIDRIVRAKLGGGTARPSGDDDDDAPTQRIRIKL